MKMKNTLLIIAISGALAACGSSSSQGTTDSSTSGSSTSGSSTSGSSTSGSSTSGSSTSGSSTSGSSTSGSSTTEAVTLKGYNGTKLSATKSGSVNSNTTYKAQSDINKLVLNGKTIDLIPSGFSVGGFFSMSGGSNVNGDTLSRKVSGSRYDSRFGVIVEDSGVTAFSQGNVTSNMPTTGTASYKGEYAGYDHKTGEMGNGTLTATVDFAKKTIAAKSSKDTNGVAGISFSGAKISGNTFSASQGGIQAKGQFYGDKATELGGTYNNKGVYTAGFGAKKQ